MPLRFDPIAEAHRQWTAHGWGEAADGMAAVTSLMRAHQLMLARVDAVLRPLRLTFARYEALMLLSFSRSGALPLSRIGARLQVHPASITSAIDKLEQQGFVRRIPHASDRRTTLAKLTPAGRRAAARATERLNMEVFADLGLPDDDVRGLVDIVRRMRQAHRDFE